MGVDGCEGGGLREGGGGGGGGGGMGRGVGVHFLPVFLLQNMTCIA